MQKHEEQVAYVDFETDAIAPRPDYPPKPVGVAIRLPGEACSKYYAWGHPTENNCTVEEAKAALQKVWDSEWAVSFHNAKFDIDVAETHLGLPMLPWQRLHDTMVLAYLVDPHAKKIGLKELADTRLGIPPTERDGVRDWLIANGIERRGTKSWGRSISKAPGELVGNYAKGDTDRTKLVFDSLYPEVVDAGMLEAYHRELQLIPVLLQNEREGVAVDLPKLEQDIAAYEAALEVVNEKIFTALGAGIFNLDSDDELANALDAKYSGLPWQLTPTGKRSTSKDSLQQVIGALEPELLALFTYRASISTCVGTFMKPWLLVAQKTSGRIHTQWNSVAQSEGGGTRTGRLSSSPNFQNIPTLKSAAFVKAIAQWEQHLQQYGLPPLPTVRGYIVADDENSVILDRDFSQQELRVLAHFEDDQLMEAYQAKPEMDLHEYAAQIINETTGLALSRKATKTLAFGLLYGMGLGALAERLGVTVEEAKKTKQAYLDTFPGVKAIQKDLAFRGKNNIAMRTWGGRRYFSEPSKVVNGVLRDFYYKLFNFLIQGSSADITKQAVLNYHNTRKHGRLMLTVHDQIIISCPKEHWQTEMELLRKAMEGLPLGAPLLSDGGVGYRWTELEACK